MKNLLRICFIVCLVFTTAFAAKKTDEKLSIEIKSLVDADIVQIYRIQHGEPKLVDEFSLVNNQAKTFQDTCAYAFYIVKYEKMYKKVYAKEGTNVQLIVSDKAIEIFKPNTENKILEDWNKVSYEARLYSLKYNNVGTNEIYKRTPYFERQRGLEKNSVAFFKKLDKYKKDQYFKNAMQVLAQAEINYFKLYTLQIPLLGKINRDELPKDLYDSLKNPNNLSNPILLDVFEYTMPYVILNASWSQYKDKLNSKPTVEYIGSTDIKVAYLLYNARVKKDRSGLKYIEQSYLDLFKSGYALQELNSLRDEYSYLVDPNKAPDFKFKNAKGEVVNFSDYNGKLIVVDVWATWCGPCKKSRPNFEALAKEMKDMEVTFMAVSIDESQLSWENYVSKLTSIELLDFERTFSKAYGLTTVPTYMIFDAKGRLLLKGAPSPDTVALKNKILEYLAQKS